MDIFYFVHHYFVHHYSDKTELKTEVIIEFQMAKELYHERQTLYRCGLHALNNVLQGPVFTKAALDEACVELATIADPNAGNGLMNWAWNPHRAPLGLGNYDVNALTFALQKQGFVMQWLDKRLPVNEKLVKLDEATFILGFVLQWLDKRLPVDEKLVKLDEAEGVLCNVVMTTMFSSLWMQRHWFAIRKIGGICYNLDSKLAAPMPFENESECYQFLQELVNTGECELFLITKEKNPADKPSEDGLEVQ
ncbi:hypothetical protein PHMEG_00016713 [Phytophthora megakarya]|uniref:ubiquitinyl hydrolase 1 n=1 Tax=Phytophthora megakarya TaxID=4795 RepID=A0A225VZU1_9STRA|nr:hypothetical protein PHMEG_00016713 [Phytophthora megakarya]